MRLPFTCRSTSRMCSRSISSSGAGALRRAAGAIGAPAARRRRGACAFGPERAGELALGHQRAVRQHARALDDVLQLADVALPARARAARARRPASGRGSACASARALAHERRGQIRNVLAAIAQRRQRHLDDVEAVEEIAAETAGGHLGAQIAVGRGDRRSRRRASAAAIRRAAPRRSRARAAAWPAPRAAARRLRRGTACRRAPPRTRRPSIRPRR